MMATTDDLGLSDAIRHERDEATAQERLHSALMDSLVRTACAIATICGVRNDAYIQELFSFLERPCRGDDLVHAYVTDNPAVDQFGDEYMGMIAWEYFGQAYQALACGDHVEAWENIAKGRYWFGALDVCAGLLMSDNDEAVSHNAMRDFSKRGAAARNEKFEGARRLAFDLFEKQQGKSQAQAIKAIRDQVMSKLKADGHTPSLEPGQQERLIATWLRRRRYVSRQT